MPPILGGRLWFCDLFDTIERRAATAIHRADRLAQSILSRAFRGKVILSAQS